MECYYYKIIHETTNPILKNVDITIILMMENSNRFNYDPFLLNLTKKTVIQYLKDANTDLSIVSFKRASLG